MRPIVGHRLWLGHAGDVRDVPSLLATGIVAVVDLALDEPPARLPRELAYCRLPLIDGPGNPRWLLRLAVAIVEDLLRAGTPALVACSAGMSRSPCIVGAALARVQGRPLPEGLAAALPAGPADLSPGLWSEIHAALAESPSPAGRCPLPDAPPFE